MDVPVKVPVDDPNEDTEWNDILRKHGIIPEKPPSPTPIIEAALSQARQEAHEARLDNCDLDELNDLEDEEDEEFLHRYRTQRLEELSAISKAARFGQVYHLQKPDYLRDVTETSEGAYVLVHLTSAMSNDGESRRLTEIWREIAPLFGEIKFCEIQGDMCIEGYPDRNCPTILVYHDGQIVRQLLTLKELNGIRSTSADVQQLLVDIGAVKSSDSRVLYLKKTQHETATDSMSSRRNMDDANSDADDDD